MTGCLPQDTHHQSAHAIYSLASDPPSEGIVSCFSTDAHPAPPCVPTILYSDDSRPDCPDLPQQQRYRPDCPALHTSGVSVSADNSVTGTIHPHNYHQHGTEHQMPHSYGSVQSPQTTSSYPMHSGFSASDHFSQVQNPSISYYGKDLKPQSQLQHSKPPTKDLSCSVQKSSVYAHKDIVQVKTGESEFQFHGPDPFNSAEHHKRSYPKEVVTSEYHRSILDQRSPYQRSSQQLSELSSPLTSVPSTSLLLSTSSCHQRSFQKIGDVKIEQTSNQQEYNVQRAATSLYYQSCYKPPANNMPSLLDKKSSLKIMTEPSAQSTDSSDSSPRSPLPDMHACTTPGLVASQGASPTALSPIKWEASTPPRSSQLHPGTPMVPKEQPVRAVSAERSPDLADSETGSSLLDDSSSSSREQSPFSSVAEGFLLRPHSDRLPSPLTKHSPDHESANITSADENTGEEEKKTSGFYSWSQHDAEFYPSKFKRRLQDRYMHSLKEKPKEPCKIKQETLDGYEKFGVDTFSACKQPELKLERPDSPSYMDSSLPKSPRRSSSETDIGHGKIAELRIARTDEADVFMEPSQVRTKVRPPSLRQQKPLDLSRGPVFPGLSSSSGSSPLFDAEHLSPMSKVYSPVFRSPHRLPYSPHGLRSPQSQSPLCSVPEGGRIFNFNVSNLLEGAHSDSDLISPSPVSPRIFTFPPHSSMLHPISDASRPALSPRAPYTPPPSFMRGKAIGGCGINQNFNWVDDRSFSNKRSLSESDMSYMCPVCGQALPSNDRLAKHMAKHLPTETVRSGDNKIHYCKVCNRSFSRSDMLTRHMRLHTGLKPYECMDCGQVFSRSDHLNTHRRTHTGEKPYACPHCPYAACRRDMITRHMRTHTKRTSRRSHYLSVPDEDDAHKPKGSLSSTDRTDSQDFSIGCSVSSVESLESDTILCSHPASQGTSEDSFTSQDQDGGSLDPHYSSFGRKLSEEEMEGDIRLYGGSSYDRFMQYRKGRNWSTTSQESVDCEEALVIREVFVDDAFLDPDPQPAGPSSREEVSRRSSVSMSSNTHELISLETKTLQKCFISSQPPGDS